MDVSLGKAANAYKLASAMGAKGGVEGGDMFASEADATKPNFAELVTEGLDKARSTAYGGEAISSKALANKAELSDLVTAVNNAELTLNTVVAIRDKLIGAYQDIIRMPI
jgi:flagellar hook-basal body complex protein FliE